MRHKNDSHYTLGVRKLISRWSNTSGVPCRGSTRDCVGFASRRGWLGGKDLLSLLLS